jgi:hypothetical protein
MARTPVLSLALVLALSVSVVTTAASAGQAPLPNAKVDASELPPSAAKRLILELQKKVREQKLALKLIQRPVGEAIRAAERARGARDAGDTKNGSLFDKLAEQWASAGQAVLRAVGAERAANKEATRLAELSTKLKRAEALLHEQQSRLGRLRAELKQLEAKTKSQKASAAGAESARVEKSGTKAPKKTPKKGNP